MTEEKTSIVLLFCVHLHHTDHFPSCKLHLTIFSPLSSPLELILCTILSSPPRSPCLTVFLILIRKWTATVTHDNFACAVWNTFPNRHFMTITTRCEKSKRLQGLCWRHLWKYKRVWWRGRGEEGMRKLKGEK